MEELGIPLQKFSFIQAPNHGDKDSIGPTMLNHSVGHPKPKGTEPSFTVLISAPEDNGAYRIAPGVVNAFSRRGARVAATQGTTKSLYSDGMPDRRGWSNAAYLTSHDKIEETESPT